jgi:predicted Zn-dependent protease
MDAGRTDQARSYFEAALAIDPKVAAARVALGVLAFQRGDAATADREIRAALEAKPDVRLAHFNLGILAEARGDVDGALAAYRREYEQHADAFKALFNAGRILQQRGDVAGARALLERAVAANGDFAEGHLYLSQAHLASGNTAAAAAAARKGIDLSPRGSPTVALGHFVLADVAVRAGRVDEAARELERGRAAEARATAAAPRQ